MYDKAHKNRNLIDFNVYEHSKKNGIFPEAFACVL